MSEYAKHGSPDNKPSGDLYDHVTCDESYEKASNSAYAPHGDVSRGPGAGDIHENREGESGYSGK